MTSGSGSPAGGFAVTAGSLPGGLILSAGGVLSGTPTDVGTFEFTVTVSNGLFPDASAPFSMTVIEDTSPPSITPNVTGTLGQNGWYTSDVSVSWTVDEPESPSTLVKSGCATTITSDTSGTPLICQATSAGGSNSVSVTIKRDATAPTVSCNTAPPGPVFVLAGAGGSVGATVTDVTSGPTAASVFAAANVASVGNKTVSLPGSDQAGNSNTVSCPYRVGYNFLGFLSPIPRSSYKAGATIPAKFMLGNAAGTKISDSEAQALAAGCKVKVGLDTATGCASYNASADTFQRDVKTSKSTSAGSYQIRVEILGPQRLGLVNVKSVEVIIRR